MLRAFTTWIDACAEGLSPVQRARVRVQHLVVVLLLAISPAYGVMLWLCDLPVPGTAVILLPLLAPVTLLLLTRRGHNELGARSISLLAFLVVLTALVGRGGIDSNSAAWLLCSPVLGYTMVGPRHGRNLSIATAMAFAGLWATEHFGPPLPWGLPPALADWMPLVDYPFITLVFGAILSTKFNIWEELVGELRDTNHRAIVEIETRKQAEERATEAVKASTTFLAIMSHEIRTPLNGVLGLTDVLLGSKLDSDQRQLAKTVKSSGRLLRALLDDVLDYSKIDSGQMDLEHIPVDLPRLCRETLSLWEEQAREKGIELELKLPPGDPVWVLGDPTKLQQILGNLVSNSIKFTDEGRVVLSVTTADDQLVLEVKDTGIGMEPEALERIFDPFRQADDSTTRRFGGTGLGLAICKGLAERMDGSLEVASTLGMGTSFTLTLPLEHAESLTESSAGSWSTTTLTGLEILVAEDNPVNQLVIQRLLERSGMTVRMTADGAECQAAWRARAPDLILMDCQMPICDGYQAASALRAAGATLPIIALTANNLLDDRAKCLQAGMNDHVGKPIELRQLLDCIERWHAHHQSVA